MVGDLASPGERPQYVKVTPSSDGGSREQLRVYLGTIPDYATEVEGVKLAGVRAGGPAEKAVLKGGDIIVSFAGQAVANIYDYTYALDAVKIGMAVPVEVVRDGNRVKLEVVPEGRK
jgi:S1-C subfamily serine protease